MLTKGEAAALLSLRNAHHGNAMWDDVQLDAWHSELNPTLTAGEAREALRRFYAADHEGRWCGPGDINAIARIMRRDAKPTEAQINRECENRRLTGVQAWAYRRQRMLGENPEKAAKNAIQGHVHRQVEPSKPKTSGRPHRNGAPATLADTGLNAILGGPR
ncbi:hypothetical protein CS006_10495 [Bifidobacterium primatium]|uniref:Uncharacterized protein n=2 Tax=Bifidobacterium TaxID=1678 RepID=A0A2M9H6D1_9BIFI|nr:MULTISPECIES: hypothetical protein [Bifidobacterium]NEG95990.1 hypothetical protein [Bifidobacterium sp. SMB2]NEH12455.1 hypothetical protein [Bifidobacterium saimiriisciurei]PJM72356.1 hypothetical protein CS006_10495 [Bifidobacterium primatium]